MNCKRNGVASMAALRHQGARAQQSQEQIPPSGGMRPQPDPTDALASRLSSI